MLVNDVRSIFKKMICDWFQGSGKSIRHSFEGPFFVLIAGTSTGKQSHCRFLNNSQSHGRTGSVSLLQAARFSPMYLCEIFKAKMLVEVLLILDIYITATQECTEFVEFNFVAIDNCFS